MIKKQDLYKWCSIPAEELESHPELVIRFRMVKDSCEMGQMMARELVDEIAQAGREEKAVSGDCAMRAKMLVCSLC